jgi:small subunit ribosomal protein S17
MREGLVVSDKMDKTSSSPWCAQAPPLYGRVQRVTKRIKAHDENNECKTGDRVRIMETRPLSKDKNWRCCKYLSAPSSWRPRCSHRASG